MTPQQQELMRTLFAPSLVSRELARKLTAIGLTRVRQSGLSIGRECRAKLAHMVSCETRRTMSPYPLLGSVCHKAAEKLDHTMARGRESGYWVELFAQVRAEDPDTDYVIDGNTVTMGHIKKWSHDLANGNSLGIPMAEIIFKFVNPLREMGFVFTEFELELEYKSSGIKFTGKVDSLAKFRGMRVIWDIKFAGIFAPIIYGKGSVKKQFLAEDKVVFYPQLRHYDWLYQKTTGNRIDMYGIIFPANLIPYKTGGKKGQMRGIPWVFAKVPSQSHVRDYERDMLEFLDSFAYKQTRDMPTNFGKPSCPDCSYFNQCLSDPSVRAFESNEYDYLRD